MESLSEGRTRLDLIRSGEENEGQLEDFALREAGGISVSGRGGSPAVFLMPQFQADVHKIVHGFGTVAEQSFRDRAKNAAKLEMVKEAVYALT